MGNESDAFSIQTYTGIAYDNEHTQVWLWLYVSFGGFHGLFLHVYHKRFLSKENILKEKINFELEFSSMVENADNSKNCFLV